ncbi:hypothetical protein [Nocardioides lacusdianchii]|jgi:hypothetical protein|uniref:hypothetical protein n=1 Tax=Nocardioides lacusdianchii TaxID=2783664 RepID=UPI001CCCB3B4|nr:hypothetical protein [Nocardioides lacusdianchii]
MQEIQFIQAWAALAVAHIRARKTDETGASELATIVIVTAIIAAAAIAIVGAIVLKFTNKANTIPTE